MVDLKAYFDIAYIADYQSRLYLVQMLKALDVLYINQQAEKTKAKFEAGKPK
jgi:hypothetical protein